MFQVRFNNIQSCVQWTSSDFITRRVEDLKTIIATSIEELCKCRFTVSNITNGGFKCFPGSESHVTFRAILRGSDQQSSAERLMYLQSVVNSSYYWLIQGQYLQLNHTCNVIIADIHSPECTPTDIFPQTTPYFTTSNETCTQINSYTVVSITWAASSTLLLAIVSGVLTFTIVHLRIKSSPQSKYALN